MGNEDKTPTYTGPEVMEIGIDGRTFRFRPNEITAKVARRVRQDAGMSIQKAMSLLDTDADIDVLATIAFAGAVQSDPKTADIDDIDNLLSYGSDVTLEFPEEEEASSPEG